MVSYPSKTVQLFLIPVQDFIDSQKLPLMKYLVRKVFVAQVSGEGKLWTLEEAEAQMKSTIGSHDWKLWPLDQVLQKAQLTVDIQQLRKE